MGREIRMVPADWEHPRDEQTGEYISLYDKDYPHALNDWLNQLDQWKCYDYAKKIREYPEQGYDKLPMETAFADWHGNAPRDKDYRPAWMPDNPPTHYQVYETVSEGTPVTPHFATKNELVSYLVAFGDDFDQRRLIGGWNRQNAKQFVEMGSAPSLMVISGSRGVQINEPRDGMPK